VLKLKKGKNIISNVYFFDLDAGGGGGYSPRENIIGRVIRVHGIPYTFQRLLGAGGFGK
jgi:hypothetical protein